MAQDLEVWKPIVGFDGYEVSSQGRVRSPQKVLKPCSDGRGYRKVFLYAKGVRQGARVHHLVARAFIGERENDLVVNHKDGVKTNNAVSNLEYVTQKENRIHAQVNGLLASGERVNTSKFTSEEAQMIRKQRGKIGTREMARLLGVTSSAISKILNEKSWKTQLPAPKNGMLDNGENVNKKRGIHAPR